MGLIGCALSPCPWLLPVALTRNGLGAVTPGPMYLRSSEPRPTRARRQETGCRSDSYALGWPPTGGWAGHYTKYEPGSTTIARGLVELARYMEFFSAIAEHPELAKKLMKKR